MDKITSFTIDHEKLLRGVYVSRIDYAGKEPITTFDIRMKRPNQEPVFDTGSMHTLEHLGATFLRNQEISDKVIYFGPMGCRTGFYLLLHGEYQSKDIVALLTDCFTYMAAFEGEIPGASAVECGNYSDQDLNIAKLEAKKYVDEVLEGITNERLNYPE